MILEDLSCYSSPLHPMSRQCQQLWLDTEQTSFSAQELSTRVEHCPQSREAVGYCVDQRDAVCSSDDTRCAPVVTQARFCSSECPGSPCAVCSLLGNDVAPSVEYAENDVRRQQQLCKLTRQGEPLSATPTGTPRHNPSIDN